VHFWDPTPDPPVNKRDLSTGETGENRTRKTGMRGFSAVSQASVFQLENGRNGEKPAKS